MKLMISCQEASRLLSESLDSPLPFRRRAALRMHLLMCYLCRRTARQARALNELIRALAAKTGWNGGDPAGLGELSPEARERVRKALKDQS
jgi:hypothetical protein